MFLQASVNVESSICKPLEMKCKTKFPAQRCECCDTLWLQSGGGRAAGLVGSMLHDGSDEARVVLRGVVNRQDFEVERVVKVGSLRKPPGILLLLLLFYCYILYSFQMEVEVKHAFWKWNVHVGTGRVQLMPYGYSIVIYIVILRQ